MNPGNAISSSGGLSPASDLFLLRMPIDAAVADLVSPALTTWPGTDSFLRVGPPPVTDMSDRTRAIPLLFAPAPPPASGHDGAAGAPPAGGGSGGDSGGKGKAHFLTTITLESQRTLLNRFRQWIDAANLNSGRKEFEHLAVEEPSLAAYVQDIVENADSLALMRMAESMAQVVSVLGSFAGKVAAGVSRCLDMGRAEDAALYMNRVYDGLGFVMEELLKEKIYGDSRLAGLVRDGDLNSDFAKGFTWHDLIYQFFLYPPSLIWNNHLISKIESQTRHLREMRLMRTRGQQMRGVLANAVFPWAFTGATAGVIVEMDIRPDLEFQNTLSIDTAKIIFSGIVRKMLGVGGNTGQPSRISIKWDDSDGAFHIESDAANLSADLPGWKAGFHSCAGGRDYSDGNGGLPLVGDLARELGWVIGLDVDERGVRFKIIPAAGDVVRMDADNALLNASPSFSRLLKDDDKHFEKLFFATTTAALSGDVSSLRKLDEMKDDPILGSATKDFADNLDLFRELLDAPDIDAFGSLSQRYLQNFAGRFLDRLKRDGVIPTVKWVREKGYLSEDLIDKLFKQKFAHGGLEGPVAVAHHDFVERLFKFQQCLDSHKRVRSIADEILILRNMLDEGRRFFDARGQMMRYLLPYFIIDAASGIRVEIGIPDGLDFMAGVDPRQMGYALIEIVYNALKYADGEKPEMWVRLIFDGDNLVVEDNGKGIADKFSPKIFDLGFRGGVHEGIGGKGIGLASVKQRLSRMGLDIDVESSVGEGAKFIISSKSGPVLVAK